MPRDPSGKYDLPENQVVGGTTILADWANNTTVDLETEITDSLSRQGKGGMQGSFKAAQKDKDGNAVIGVSWVDEPTTGRYLQSAGVVVEAIQGNDVVRYTSSGLEEFRDGSWVTLSSQDAIQVPYDNTVSNLSSTNVQDAIDELDSLIDTGYVTFAGDETISGAKTFTASETRIDGDVYLGASENKILGANRNALLYQSSNGITAIGNTGALSVVLCDDDEGVVHQWGSGNAYATALNESNFMKLMQDTITDAIFPVGSVHLTTDEVNPQAYLAGTWARVSEPGYLGAIGTANNTDLGGNSYNIVPGFTNGYISVNIGVDQMPEHTHAVHGVSNLSDTGGGDPNDRHLRDPGETNNTAVNSGSTGGNVGTPEVPLGEDLPVYPPVLGNYVWVRTA